MIMRKFFIAALSATILMFSAGAGYAADAKIAVLDYSAVVAKSKAGKSLQEQVVKQQEAFKTEFGKLEKDLGEDQKKLEADKDKANTPEFAAKRKAFEGKMVDAQKQVQQRRIALEKGTNEALGDIRKGITKVVGDIAKKEGYTIVLTRDNVVLADSGLDITDKVLAQFDGEMSSIKLNVSK